MSKNTTAVITTACVGMAVGAAAYMMSGDKSLKNRTRRIRKNTGKVLRQAGQFIGEVSSIIK